MTLKVKNIASNSLWRLGSRLWPLSRESFPKQYLFLNPYEKKSFLQKTVERLKGFDNVLDPIIIYNESHRFIVAEQLREINVKPKEIILEPCGRNTASHNYCIFNSNYGIPKY